jgi:hypothetical protein
MSRHFNDIDVMIVKQALSVNIEDKATSAYYVAVLESVCIKEEGECVLSVMVLMYVFIKGKRINVWTVGVQEFVYTRSNDRIASPARGSQSVNIKKGKTGALNVSKFYINFLLYT